MRDLISRQAAIDAYILHTMDYLVGEKPRRAFTEVLRDLPSAQPEIIHCKDCKHYNAGFECLIEGYGIERDANWFCGDAERKTDETTI